jgi:hypothetical protein
MGEKGIKDSKLKEESRKTDKIPAAKRKEQIEEAVKKEIEEQILKQQHKHKEKKEAKSRKKEEKLEDIIESSRKKGLEKDDSAERWANIYGIDFGEKKLSYEYSFSYLHGKKEKRSSNYEGLVSSGKANDLADDFGVKEIMDIKEQRDYAIRQAANFLVGTSMNDITYDEKERFNALMTVPSDKIAFLINYSMTGMNFTMAQPVVQSAKYSKVNEVKITNEQIREKSMKNDPLISLRFDTKSSAQKDYAK